jgi:protein tyrosine phosphatase (PTP) superfamily phosphohydrolase (DUF442 family)
MLEPLESIYNFLPISDRLATAGQPTEEQFAAIKEAGYQVVINLALPSSTNAIAQEQTIVEALGMRYIHIPVLWENPTLTDVEQFFDVMNANSHNSVFVHCAMNMRVSAFMYLYQRIHNHVSDQSAKAELEKIWTPNETWQTFIQRAIAHFQSISENN